MREKIVVLRGCRLASLLMAVILASTLGACGSSSSVVSGPGITCASYALHGTGRYHNEISVRVKVSNSTTHPARFAVDVVLTAHQDGAGNTPPTLVTIHGSVASHASAELSRKVLTAGAVRRCRVRRITRLGGP